jgi:hypothetical protein
MEPGVGFGPEHVKEAAEGVPEALEPPLNGQGVMPDFLYVIIYFLFQNPLLCSSV